MKKQLQGVVISAKMDKTIVVRVERIKKHPKYLKRYKIYKNYKVHDENKEAKLDDRIIFEECRPISREKRWKLIQILNPKS